jgi:hypothetical protein
MRDGPKWAELATAGNRARGRQVAFLIEKLVTFTALPPAAAKAAAQQAAAVSASWRPDTQPAAALPGSARVPRAAFGVPASSAAATAIDTVPLTAGTVVLADSAASIEWRKTAAGWTLSRVAVIATSTTSAIPSTTATSTAAPLSFSTPSGRATLLYSAEKPDETPRDFAFTGATAPFPEPDQRIAGPKWRKAVIPALLNTAGTAIHFFPDTAARAADGALVFAADLALDGAPLASVTAEWRADPAFPGDFLVTTTLTARRDGFYSLSTPALATLDPADIAWALIPGYFKGNTLNPDIPASLGYGHGLPALPAIVPERNATTPASIATVKNGLTLSVLAEPWDALDPWPAAAIADRSNPRLGLSHMTRDGALSPTLWQPILGKTGSALKTGDTRRFAFRYSLRAGAADGWFDLVKHSANDIFRLRDFLALKKPARSLSQRLHSLHAYVVSDQTSLWHTETFNDLKIGAQAYNASVVGSQRDKTNRADYDPMKNSDYGAMWMLAKITGDPRLARDRLPFARNFKLAQQQTAPGFFQGAALGQYYLAKSQRFTEEWGDYVEPIAITYYTMLDLGNFLLFEPDDAELCARLRLGADRLLAWQKPAGDWEVAYDHATQKPLFTEIPDYRPTFYGLVVAAKILGDPKYLDAARRGADWLVENSVKPARFLGVCGDTRFAPDFATAQMAQAFLDLHELTGDPRHRAAGIECARQYVTEIYARHIATVKKKTARGVAREDWEINQTGLSFEHGGSFGSAVTRGPILLSSYAGLFIRVAALTGEPLFRDLARAAMLARDAFLHPGTQVASYYWSTMHGGPGGFPHHAWWQIGLITDYLVSEAALRSAGAIAFPRGFITPKVGPHACFGFAPGTIHGAPARLAWAEIETGLPEVDYLAALSPEGNRAYLVLLNNSPRPVRAAIKASPAAFACASPAHPAAAWKTAALLDAAGGAPRPLDPASGPLPVELPAYGLAVLTLTPEEPCPKQ